MNYMFYSKIMEPQTYPFDAMCISIINIHCRFPSRTVRDPNSHFRGAGYNSRPEVLPK
jgi:hypothetical protein